MRLTVLAASVRSVMLMLTAGCSIAGCQEITRLQARPAVPLVVSQPGEHPLGLGGARDGTLYLPATANAETPLPLLVLMHGAGQRKELFRYLFPLAEELGVVILTIDSRGTTWDGVGGRFGPDVEFIDAALGHTFERVAVDARRIALGGFSDGASYALSLGLMNGDLFTHLVAFSPGFLARPAPSVGRPHVFITHGTSDDILPIDLTSRRLVPELKSGGYAVTYREFAGGHRTSPEIAREGLTWLIRTPPSQPSSAANNGLEGNLQGDCPCRDINR